MISGYASVFYNPRNAGTQFRMGPGYVERFAPGAFDEFLSSSEDVVALFNHDPSLVLGRLSAGTLDLKADQRGLFYKISEADTTISRDVQEHQRRGDVIGSSIGFLALDESHTHEQGLDVRTILKAAIRDVGPVTYPAYPGTADQRGGEVRMVFTDGSAMALSESCIAETRSRDDYRLFLRQQVQARIRLIEVESYR